MENLHIDLLIRVSIPIYILLGTPKRLHYTDTGLNVFFINNFSIAYRKKYKSLFKLLIIIVLICNQARA